MMYCITTVSAMFLVIIAVATRDVEDTVGLDYMLYVLL